MKRSYEMIFHIGSVILLVLGIYIWWGIGKFYSRGETIPIQIAIAIWFLHIVHHLLIILSSLWNIWPLPIDKSITIIGGLIMFIIGIVITSVGLIKFRSFRRAAGLLTSKLIITGIYRWSRNPQQLGLYILLFGISFMGYSGFAILFTIIFIVYMHLYIIFLEEPYLELVFGEKYRLYKSRAARYIGKPKEKNEIEI